MSTAQTWQAGSSWPTGPRPGASTQQVPSPTASSLSASESLQLVQPNFAHLLRLTTAKGVFEHCLGPVPRPEHGYCTDDVARALIAVAREPVATAELERAAGQYLDFLYGAYRSAGRFVNRRHLGGSWVDDGLNDDASGRAVWALGTAAARLHDPVQRRLAKHLFDEACQFRSPWIRPSAYAVFGAGEVAAFDPSHVGVGRLLADAAGHASLFGGSPGSVWPWPEKRLTYSNAVIPQMLIVVGRDLRLQSFLIEGLRLLRWLIAIETGTSGWFSVTPAGGWGVGETRPGFDQQPIEVAALADACAVAWQVTGDPRWAMDIVRCGGWFAGVNDSHVPMVDHVGGGGFDGLTADGRNDNRGAESTIAALTTLQWVRMAVPVTNGAPS